MRNIKTIFILVLSLILLLAVSCSNEDKTGGENNTPENDTELLGTYRDENVASAGYSGVNFDTKVSYDETTTKTTKIEGTWLKDGTTDTYRAGAFIEKWKQTKKDGKTIKLEGEFSDAGGGKYIITYDYASRTLSGTYAHPDGTKASFNGKKIS